MFVYHTIDRLPQTSTFGDRKRSGRTGEVRINSLKKLFANLFAEILLENRKLYQRKWIYRPDHSQEF